MAAQRKAISQWQSTGMTGGALGIGAGVLSTLAAVAALVLAQPVCGVLPACGPDVTGGCLAPGGLCLPSGMHFAASVVLSIAGPGGVLSVVLGRAIRQKRRKKGRAPEHEHPEHPIAE